MLNILINKLVFIRFYASENSYVRINNNLRETSKNLEKKIIKKEYLVKFSKSQLIYSPIYSLKYIILLIFVSMFMTMLLLLYEFSAKWMDDTKAPQILKYIESIKDILGLIPVITISMGLFALYKLLNILIIDRIMTKTLNNIYESQVENLFNNLEASVFYEHSLENIKKEHNELEKHLIDTGNIIFKDLLPVVMVCIFRWIIIGNQYNKQIVANHLYTSSFKQSLLKLLVALESNKALYKLKIDNLYEANPDREATIYSLLRTRLILSTLYFIIIFYPLFFLDSNTKSLNYYESIRDLISNFDYVISNNIFFSYRKSIKKQIALSEKKNYFWEIAKNNLVIPVLVVTLGILLFKYDKIGYYIDFLMFDLYSLYLIICMFTVRKLLINIYNYQDFKTILQDFYYHTNGKARKRISKNKYSITHISYKNVDLIVNNHTILENINLQIKPGMYLLYGKSGSGKSTLFNSLCGIIKPSNGVINMYYKKNNINKLKPSQKIEKQDDDNIEIISDYESNILNSINDSKKGNQMAIIEKTTIMKDILDNIKVYNRTVNLKTTSSNLPQEDSKWKQAKMKLIEEFARDLLEQFKKLMWKRKIIYDSDEISHEVVNMEEFQILLHEAKLNFKEYFKKAALEFNSKNKSNLYINDKEINIAYEYFYDKYIEDAPLCQNDNFIDFLEDNIGQDMICDIKDIPRVDLIEHVAYCRQNPQIPNVTIQEFFQQMIKDREIDVEFTTVLEQVDLYEWYIQNPLKEHTKIGNSGKQLSGGQITRLILAQNLFKIYDPVTKKFNGILLVDESLDNVDFISRRKIIHILNKLVVENENLTVIIVSHLDSIILENVHHRKIHVADKTVRME